MPDPVVGKRYRTKYGIGICTEITPYQAQLTPDVGDDPVWLPHSMMLDYITEPEDVRQYGIGDLIEEIEERVALLKEIIGQAEAEAQREKDGDVAGAGADEAP